MYPNGFKDGDNTSIIHWYLLDKDVKYLEQDIVYDRKQPEFYEDTITSVSYTHLTLPTILLV